MDIDEGQKVVFLNNENVMDDTVCVLIENIGDHCRIQKPDGEILRIFRDRVHLYKDDNKPMKKDESIELKFNPWNNLPENAEVWIKSNRFNETSVCETITVIVPGLNKYQSINTYDGVAKKTMEYPLKNINALIKRMIKKGYVKQERPSK